MLDERAQKHLQLHFLKRLKNFSILVVLVFSMITLRFYYLQIIKGPYYRGLSENNRLDLVSIRAPRGIIFDRRQRVMVSNRPSFSVSLVLEEVENLEKTKNMLIKTLSLDQESFGKAIKKVGRYRQFEPIRISEDISRASLGSLEIMKFQYPGIHVEVEPRRHYPRGSMASHLLGHVGEINPLELEQKKNMGYRVGDYIGKLGLEKEFNDILKGMDGGLQVEVDSLGRRLRVINNQEPLPGYNLVLALDLDIQKSVEEYLGDVRGAVVVMDPRNGEILASASHPDFNPNLFAGGISTEDWKELSSDGRHPLQNRVIQSQYPPGSIYKIVTAIAGLQEGIVNRKSTVYCSGGFEFGNRYYRCWKKEGHGAVNLHRAIVESCDTYFYYLGEKLGIETIAHYARELGLGSHTGIELPGEWSGLVPDSAWKKKTRGEIWFPGETLSASIGQGYNLVTPIQMAVMISALANGGDVYRPIIVKAITSSDGRVIDRFQPQLIRHAGIKAEVLDQVREGMRGVVNESHGTGWQARLDSIEVAGKTGTAQVVKLRPDDEEDEQEDLPEALRDHAWFGCFAPYDSPYVTVVVMLEHGGHGGSASAPIARKIITDISSMVGNGEFTDEQETEN